MSDLLPLRDMDERDLQRERRLDEIRREAERRGQMKVISTRPAGAPFPQASPETGYYGIPLLKQPPWTWEIPLYFFVGGAAGAAAVIGAIADYTGADRELVRHARWVAAAGSVISPALLVSDLGRPERFLAMLRVFKPQSPMSVGVWTLLGFSTGAAAAAFAGFLRDRYGPSLPLNVLENAGQAASLAFGLPFSNYTGVLIGATAIPVWNHNAGDLPLHFAASGLGAAVGILELLGHRKSSALQALGLGAAIFETWEGLRIEGRSHYRLDPLKHGPSGWITRTGGALSGPVPAILRLASLFGSRKRASSLRRWASWSAIAGSLITRIAWIHAGHVSARDWKLPLQEGTPEPRQMGATLRQMPDAT
ncbi:MAG TPA: NrfD/PsrC family molybdoenzyme membrane anchor subunit [Candidatus Sulfotelmatobacter sp.]|nr:NrfD/PsrC family molybdoenzyme membrane anchor subunit [Candidatus Sulfotelmatobacter sp.]